MNDSNPYESLPMIPLWRLVRNRYSRMVYETLSTAGLTVSRMVEYEVDLRERASLDGTGPPDVPAQASFHTAPARTDPIRRLDLDFSIPVTFLDDEWVIAATAGGEAVGRSLVSAGQYPRVDALGGRMTFDGAYIRRVYVHPEWRNRGLARRLVAETLRVANRQFGVDTATALIAPDNKPSRWAFEANGFEPVRRHDYLSVFGREYRRVTGTD